MSDDKREVRRTPKCNFTGKVDSCNVVSKILRANNPCDDSRYDPCDVGSFTTPRAATFKADEGLPALPVIVISNAELTLGCDAIGRYDVDHGDPVTVNASKFTRQVALSGMPDLTDVDQQRITDLSDEVINSLVGMTAEQIKQTLYCTTAQSEYLYNEIQSNLSEVATRASNYVESELETVCYWTNDELTVTCSPDSDGVPASDPGYFTVEAGNYISYTSKSDANEQANLYASTQLLCFWTNDEILLECPSDADTDRSSPPAVVEAGTITSYLSKADANAQATSLAESALTCVWGSDSITICCPENSDGQTYLDTTDDDGNPLACQNIAYGEYVSTVSKADANAQRDDYASTALDRCHYCSAAVTSSCPTVNLIYSPEQDAFGTDSMGDSCEVTVPVTGTLVSGSGLAACFCQSPAEGGSQAEANQCAQDYLDSMSLCRYGNPQIGARCAPASEGGQETSTDCVTYSAGIGGGWFTATDALTAANAALSVSKTPSRYRVDYPWRSDESVSTLIVKPRSVNCCYESADVTVKCGPRPSTTSYPTYTPNPSEEYDIPGTPVHGGDDDPDDVTGARWGLSDASYKTHITLASGSVTRCNVYSVVDCEEVKSGDYDQTTVDAEALEIAKGALVCSWESEAATVYCDFTVDAEEYNRILDDGYSTSGQYDPLSVGSEGTPVVADKGQYVSYTSWSDANAARNSALSASTSCFWSNAKVELSCWDADSIESWITEASEQHWDDATGIVAGTGEVYPDQPVSSMSRGGSVTARSYINYVSQAAANEMAKRAAGAQADCFYTNATINLKCASDKSGWHDNNGTYETGTISLGDGKLDGVYEVYQSSTGSTSNPVDIPGMVYRSYVSQYDANDIAITAGEGLLLCFYLSPKVTAYCGQYTAAYLDDITVAFPTDSSTANTEIVLDGRTEPDPGDTLIPFSACTGVTSGSFTSTEERIPEFLHEEAPACTLEKGTLLNYSSWSSLIDALIPLAKSSALCGYTNPMVWCSCDFVSTNPSFFYHIPTGGGQVSVESGTITSLVGSQDAIIQAYTALKSAWDPVYDAAPFACNGQYKGTSDIVGTSVNLTTGECDFVKLDITDASLQQKKCEVGEVQMTPATGLVITQETSTSGGKLEVTKGTYGLQVSLDDLYATEKLLQAKYVVDCVYSRLTAEAVVTSPDDEPYVPGDFEASIDVRFSFAYEDSTEEIGSSTVRFISHYKCFRRTSLVDKTVDEITVATNLPDDVEGNEATTSVVDLEAP